MRREPFLVAFVCSCAAAQLLAEQAYYVDGEVSHKYYSEPGVVGSSSSRYFRLAVRDCLWLIRTFGGDAEKNNIKYTEVGTDGTNVYTVIPFLPQILEKTGTAKWIPNKFTGQLEMNMEIVTNRVPVNLTNVINIGLAGVQSGTAATDVAHLVAPVWVAYASGCYYGRSGGSSVKPAWVHSDPDVAYSNTRFPALIKQDQTFPYLPQWIAYFSDGKGRLPGSEGTFEFKLAPPYHNGFTNAIYQVNVTTNVGGLNFPLVSTLVMFCQASAAAVSSNDLHSCNVFEIRANRISLGTSVKEFRPFLPPRALITDRRIETGLPLRRAVTYLSTTTNGWLIDLASLKLTQEFGIAYSKYQKERREQKARPMTAASILALMIGPTMIWAWATARSRSWGRKLHKQ